MFSHMPRDVLSLIGLCIGVYTDLCSFLCTTRATLHLSNDEWFMYEYACLLYSKAFWEKAQRRPRASCNALGTVSDELRRIERFQAFTHRIEGSRWSMEQFEKYWSAYDNAFAQWKFGKRGLDAW